MIKRMLSSLPLLLLLLGAGQGCSSDRDESAKSSDSAGSTMKCGVGKCGAGMADGNIILAKKRRNILSQMRKDDSRRDCVDKAQNTKVLYDCVRGSKEGRLTTKCGVMKEGEMRCGAGKCSGG